MSKIVQNYKKIKMNITPATSQEIIIPIKHCVIANNDVNNNLNDTILLTNSNSSQKMINKRKSMIYDNWFDHMWAAIDILPQSIGDTNDNNSNLASPRTPDKKPERLSFIESTSGRLRSQSATKKMLKKDSLKSLVVDTSYQMTEALVEPEVPTPQSFFANKNVTPTSPLSGFWSSPFITTPSGCGMPTAPSTSTDAADIKSEIYNHKIELKYQRIIRRKLLSILEAQLQSAV